MDALLRSSGMGGEPGCGREHREIGRSVSVLPGT